MSLITRLASRFRAEPSLSGAIRIGGQQYNAQWSYTRVLDSVYKNPTGKRCIERNAYAFMKPAWQVVDAKADRAPIENHRILDVLNAPMPHSTGTKMQYFLRRDLDLNGGTFWLKMYGADLYGDRGPVTGLKRLPPQQVAVLSNDDDELLGFIYTDRAGKRAPILPEEMIYVNLPDGEREWDRCAPGVAAGLPADIDNAAMRFNAELIANDGGLPGYLIVEGLDRKKFAEWTAAWRAGETPGKTRVLSSHGANGKGGASYVRVAVSNQEMMYDRLREFAQDDICRALGYPSVLLNPDGTTFANMDKAQQTYIVGEVLPMWVWTSDFFSVALRDQLAPGLQIGFDLSMVEELTENLDAIVERGVKLVAAKAMTINELRDELGLPPVAWGNDFPEPPPADSGEPPAGPDPSQGDDKPTKSAGPIRVLSRRVLKATLAPRPRAAAKAFENLTDVTITPLDAKGNPVGEPIKLPILDGTVKVSERHDSPSAPATAPETKAASEYLSRFHIAVEAREKSFAPKVEAFLRNQGEAIARRIESKKGKSYRKAVEDWWDGDRWDDELTSIVHEGLAEAAEDAGSLAMATFSDAEAFDATSDRQLEYLQDRAVEITGLVNNATKEQLRDLIGELAADETSVVEIAREIREAFENDAAKRALRVARTELIGAANFAAEEAAFQSDVVTAKRWNAAATADEECLALDAHGPIPLGDSFPGGFEQPPAHVNCRCALTFDVE